MMQTNQIQTIMASVVNLDSLGQFLRLHRTQLGMTQHDVAKKLAERGFQFSRTSITHWEKDRFMPPINDPAFVRALAEILNVSEEEVLQAVGFNLEIDPESDTLPDWFREAYKNATTEQRKMLNRIFRSILEDESDGDSTG